MKKNRFFVMGALVLCAVFAAFSSKAADSPKSGDDSFVDAFYSKQLDKQPTETYVGANLGISFKYFKQFKQKNNHDTWHGDVEYSCANPWIMFHVSDYTRNWGTLDKAEAAFKRLRASITRLTVSGMPAVKAVEDNEIHYLILRNGEKNYWVTVTVGFMKGRSKQFEWAIDAMMNTFEISEVANRKASGTK